jgi:septum formation inhibitor MinC
MARIQNGITQSSWQFLSTALATNAKDLPHLEGHRVELADTLAKTEDLTTQLAALTASKQDISKQLTALMDNGRKLATFLRVGVKQNYGNRSEKLVEFGLQPLRTRRKPADTPTPAPTPTPTPTPAAPGTTTPSAPALSPQQPPSSTDAPAPTGSGH